LGMVVAEQMQEAVHRKQVPFIIDRMTGLARLPSRQRYRDHDVAQPVFGAGWRLKAPVGRLLARGEGEHVGRLIEPATATVVLTETLSLGALAARPGLIGDLLG